MPDVTGWSEEEILDYENGLAAQESPSSPRQEVYLDACRVAAMRSIDEGFGTQWLKDEERKLRSLYLAERLDRLEKLLLAGVVWRKCERST